MNTLNREFYEWLESPAYRVAWLETIQALENFGHEVVPFPDVAAANAEAA